MTGQWECRLWFLAIRVLYAPAILYPWTCHKGEYHGFVRNPEGWKSEPIMTELLQEMFWNFIWWAFYKLIFLFPQIMAKVLIQTSPLDSNKSHQRHDSQSSDGHPFLFTDVAHSRDFVNNLFVLRQHEEFCDMVLVVGNKSITAHKVVLASNSPYFRAMFTGMEDVMFTFLL